MKSVFTKLWLKTPKGDLDISDAVQDIHHESERKKGTLIEFKIASHKALDLANHPNLVPGGILTYQYGFINSINQSAVSKVRVGNVRYDFNNGRVQLLVRCTDKSIELKKNESHRIWHNVTLYDVCKELAEKYGLNFRGEATDEKYTSLPQAGRTDWELLKYLKIREQESYFIEVDNATLFLKKNLRNEKSRKTYVYGENVVSLRIDLKEISQQPSTGAATNLDERTGKPTAPPPPPSDSEKVDGKFSVGDISKAAVKTTKSFVFSSLDEKKIGEETIPIFGADSGSNKAKNISNNTNKERADKVLTCELLVELDTARSVGEVVTIKLPVDKLSGNWVVDKMTHKITMNGAFTELNLVKNGTNKPIKALSGENKNKVNNTEGAKDSEQKFRIYESTTEKRIK